jgi:GrpB-like predicted nucleotidyltransferase (UPF0157 family)
MQKNQKITISNYKPNWIVQFQTLKAVLLENLQNEPIEIEHVGSASIPGMKAKPIIDLDIIIEIQNSTSRLLVFSPTTNNPKNILLFL